MVQKVAIYCRVSTADQSCTRQERDLLEYAALSGFEIVGVWKETASGVKYNRTKRTQVMALAQSHGIDAILVTEMTRWGRSTIDLIETLQSLHSWHVSLIAQTGLQFDLSTPQGRLIAHLMASLAEFERDLVRERVRSGIAAAKARGQKLGRQQGQRVKADKLGAKVLQLVESGCSYRKMAKSAQRAKFVHLANKSGNYSVVQSQSIASATFIFPGFWGVQKVYFLHCVMTSHNTLNLRLTFSARTLAEFKVQKLPLWDRILHD